MSDFIVPGMADSTPPPVFGSSRPYLNDGEVELLGIHIYQTLILEGGELHNRQEAFLHEALVSAYEITDELRGIHFAMNCPQLFESFQQAVAGYLLDWVSHALANGIPNLSFPTHYACDLWGPRIRSRRTQIVASRNYHGILDVSSRMRSWSIRRSNRRPAYGMSTASWDVSSWVMSSSIRRPNYDGGSLFFHRVLQVYWPNLHAPSFLNVPLSMSLSSFSGG